MRFLLLLVSVAFASNGATSAAVVPDKTGISKFNALDTSDQFPRSLRGYVDKDDEEDRGIEKVTDKVDDALAIVLNKPLRLPTGLNAAALARADDVTAKVEDALKKYPQGLSADALKQLRKVEEQRLKDLAILGSVTKITPDGMRREIEPFPGMKVAPTLTSNIGRADQRYTADGGRMTVCAVVTRPKSEGGGILLISTSKLDKQDFILPKGGWDYGESVEGAFVAALADQQVGKHVYNSFLMQATKTYDQWPESMRHRIWLSWDDAITMLKDKRPEMVQIVERARAAAARAA